MNSQLKQALIECETNIDDALFRLSVDEDMYVKYLQLFLSDTTVRELESALNSKSWDEAFTTAHAIKGVAANLGFIPLYHSISELVFVIRSGRINDIQNSFSEVQKDYREIVTAISRNV